MTTFYPYRKSLSPFSVLDASIIIREQLSCVDSQVGAGGLSVQLNLQGDKLWLQNVIQVLKGNLWTWTFYALDAIGKVQLWAPLAVPFAQGSAFGTTGDYVSLHFDAAAGLRLGIGIAGRSTLQSLAPTLATDIYVAALEVVGQGGGSNAQFSSGAIDCDLEAQGVDDMAYWQSPPQNAPPGPWLNKSTDETSNLSLKLGLLAPSALKWSLEA